MNKNNPVLITGCSTGIGRCLALGLHARGYHVIASCRNPDDLSALAEFGLDVIVLDLDDSESIGSGLAKTLELTDGKLFGLINNGAYGQPGAVEDLTRTSLRAQFETNVFGTQELTQPSYSDHATAQYRQNNTDQFGSRFCLLEIPWRLQRQQVCSGRVNRYHAPGTGRVRDRIELD